MTIVAVFIVLGVLLVLVGVACAHRIATNSASLADHPICNNCGYAAGPDRTQPCPECGADLSQPDAIIVPLPDWRLVAGAVAGFTLGITVLLMLLH